MGSRRPEMAEVDQTEYVFGEHGGRGAPASTFFRRIASMTSSTDVDDDTESLQQRPVGAGLPHLGQAPALPGTKAASKSSSKSKSKLKLSKHRHNSAPDTRAGSATPRSSSLQGSSYFDLDDDWDASVETSLQKLSNETKLPASDAEAVARAERDELNSRVSRIMRFQSVLDAPTVDLDELRKLAWTGVPADLRPRTWMQLLGYLPSTAARRHRTLAKKRQEYLDGVAQTFGSGEVTLDSAMWHQISIDVPRTNPHIPLYSFDATRRLLERILYLWAMRHPASGYVQGINDLVTPFLQTFLTQYVGTSPVETLDPGILPKEQLDCVEADSYWCLTKLLDGIQDNYIHAQPGIHRQVDQLEKLVTKIDADLVAHLGNEGIGFMQFSFRWMNCLLMRELPMNCIIRIWDAYLSEGPGGFSAFHVYVCTAFLIKWSKELKTMDFQDMMIFLQRLPTEQWTEKEVELLLSEAFMYQALFKDTLI